MKIQSLYRSEFIRNSFSLFSANGFAQLIPFLAYLLLARIYSPAQFGTYALFLSIGSLLAAIVNGRLDLALPLSKSEQESSALMKLALIIAFIISGTFLLLSFPLRTWICLDIFHDEQLYSWFPFISLSLIGSGIVQSLNYYAAHKKKFNKIALYHVSLSLLASAFRIGLGYLGFDAGLIIGTLVGTSLSTIVFVFLLWGDLKKTFLLKTSQHYLVSCLKRHQNFPKYNSLHALSNTLGGNLPVLILGAFVGKEITGIYSLAVGILNKPIIMISNALNSVLYKKSIDLIKENRPLLASLKKVLLVLAATSIPPALAYYLVPHDIFTWLFGSNWSGVKEMVHYLLPWMLMILFVSPLNFIPNLFGKQKRALLHDLIYTALRSGALIIGVYVGTWQFAILLYTGFSIVWLGYYLGWYRSLVIEKLGVGSRKMEVGSRK